VIQNKETYLMFKKMCGEFRIEVVTQILLLEVE